MIPSVYTVLVLIALALTLISGTTNPSRMPVWIPLLLVTIALLIGTFVRS
jgi:hypothetical protein